jgi:hypothetical protein
MGVIAKWAQGVFLTLAVAHAVQVPGKPIIRRDGEASLTQSDGTGTPMNLVNTPEAFTLEHSRCAGSWKDNVFTPRLATQEELGVPEHADFMALFHEEPVMHRRQWEYGFLLRILDKLPQLHKAIGFAVHDEPTVSYLASENVSVIATHLPLNTTEAKAGYDELFFSKEAINSRHIATPEQMDEYVKQDFVDMNTVESSKVWKQAGTYDLVWSLGSVGHLGTIRSALNFMEKSLELLKPGGAAVHTSEFNVGSTTATMDGDVTVLLRKSDVDLFHNCVAKKGFDMVQPCYDLGNEKIDQEYDTPPYSPTRHLRLQIGQFPATCIGFAIQKPVDFVDNGYKCTAMFDEAGLHRSWFVSQH